MKIWETNIYVLTHLFIFSFFTLTAAANAKTWHIYFMGQKMDYLSGTVHNHNGEGTLSIEDKDDTQKTVSINIITNDGAYDYNGEFSGYGSENTFGAVTVSGNDDYRDNIAGYITSSGDVVGKLIITDLSADHNSNSNIYDFSSNASLLSHQSSTAAVSTTDQCATYNFQSSTLHIPCLTIGQENYSLDLKLINKNPVQLELQGMAKPQDDQENTIFRGWVTLGKPVSGASLNIYSLDGKAIYHSEGPVTSGFGSFLIGVEKKLPSDFRVICTPSSSDHELTGIELMADVRNYNSNTDTIYVNAVTTLVSRYMDRHKDTNVTAAINTVKAFLEIPDYVTIGRGLSVNNAFFSHLAFLNEAKKNGGLSAFIEILIDEMETPGSATHSFPQPEGLLKSMTGPTVNYVLDGLTKGALSYVGGNTLGWGLKMLGLGSIIDPDNGAEMINTLNGIKNQITQLSNQMANLRNELKGAITEALWNRYDNKNDEIFHLALEVRQIQDDLTTLVSDNSSGNTTWRNDETTRIKNAISKFISMRNQFHGTLYGDQSSESLLKLWIEVVKSRHRFITSDDYKTIKGLFDYYDKIQLALLELVVEYAVSKGAPNSTIQRYIDEYRKHRELQLKMLPQKVPEGLFVDTKTGKMWMRRPVEATIPGYYYKSWVGLYYVHGNPPMLDQPNSKAPINYTAAGYGFHNWMLPTPEDLDELMDDYNGNRATEDWFVKNGAFQQGLSMEAIFMTSGGNVWTRNWYWDASRAREMVTMKCIGVDGKTTEVAILKEGAAQMGSIFPVRIPMQNERYY